MKKDFSACRKETLLQLVETVELPDNFSDPYTWFDGSQSELMTYVNEAGITNIINRRDVLKNSIHDKNKESARQIESIFLKAEEADLNGASQFNRHDDTLKSLGSVIKRYETSIEPSSASFCTAEKLASLKKSDVVTNYNMKRPDPEKQRVVEEYEREHPEVAAKMNETFSGMENGAWTYDKNGNRVTFHPGTPEDVMNIKYIAYTAEEPYRSLFLDNVSKVNIVPTDGGSCYSNVGGETIKINWNDSSIMANDSGGPYAVFYHEYGHFLDDIYTPGKGNVTDEFPTSGNITLQEAIDNDVEAVVTQRVDDLCTDLDEADKAKVVDRLIHGNLPGYKDDDSDDIIKAAKYVQAKLYGELSAHHAGIISDQYDSSTNFLEYDENPEKNVPIQYYSLNNGKGVAGESQHDNVYYFKGKFGEDSDGNRTLTITSRGAFGSVEGFAHYFSNCMLGFDTYASLYEEYLPTTVGYYEEVITYMSETQLP